MTRSYTAKYTKITSGYMGQLVEWPEVITEGRTIEECRTLLRDALKEMIVAYKEQGREIPPGGDLLEQVPVEGSLSVKRRDLVQYLETNGFNLREEDCPHQTTSNYR